MPDVRELNLWEMVVWVYRDQRAHQYLKRPMDWFLWSLAFHEIVEDSPRASVHPDAAQFHAAVCGLTKHQAELLVNFAEESQQPQPPSAMPVPYPVRVDRGISAKDSRWDWMRWSRATIRGQLMDYMIRWHEYASIIEPVFERHGRKMKQVGTKAAQSPIEYCPVDWSPSLDWVIALAKIHSDWLYAMQALAQALDGQVFRDHCLSGSGIENNEAVNWEELMDWRRLQEKIGTATPEIEVDLSRDKITTQDAETFYRRNARATLV